MTDKEFNSLTSKRGKIVVEFNELLESVFTDKQLEKIWKGNPDKAFGRAWAALTKRLNWIYRNRKSIYLEKHD